MWQTLRCCWWSAQQKKKPKMYPEVLGHMQENLELVEFVAGLQVEGEDVDMIDKWQLAALLAFLPAFYTRHDWLTQKAVFDTEGNGMVAASYPRRRQWDTSGADWHQPLPMIHSVKYYVPRRHLKMRKLLLFVAEQRTAPASCGWLDIACLQGRGVCPVTPRGVCPESSRLRPTLTNPGLIFAMGRIARRDQDAKK